MAEGEEVVEEAEVGFRASVGDGGGLVVAGVEVEEDEEDHLDLDTRLSRVLGPRLRNS